MSKPKGLPKTGGRQKGTPNKTTASTKQWVESLLESERVTFARKMAQLEPDKYCTLYASMLNYVMPKQQAVSIEQQKEAEYKQLEALLQSAPDEAIERIAQKVMEMQRTEPNIKSA